MGDWTSGIIPPPGERAVHVCIDMQRLFSTEGPWPTPWMERVLPAVSAVAAHAPERTVFTRFIPPPNPEAMTGTWRAYYERWRDLTGERLDPRLLELVPPLAAMSPAATVLDKRVYSAFGGRLAPLLAERGADSIILTGGETDVCVLSTLLDAVDQGLFVYVVADALCSSSDQGHDAVMQLLGTRFSQQVALIDVAALLAVWPPG